MKSIRLMLAGASLLLLCSCGAQVQKETQVANANESKENAVIETIMSRRSIRQYKPQAVNRDTMQIILDCGINAPNGQNKQSWEVRVVDNPDFHQRHHGNLQEGKSQSRRRPEIQEHVSQRFYSSIYCQ